MSSSGFVNIKDRYASLRVDNTAKSVTFVVVFNEKEYFKKQLKDEYKSDLRHRMAMYKEFNVGQQIRSPYIVRYVGIGEDENGLYVLMEHINGVSLAEKIQKEPEYFCNISNIKKMLTQLLKALKALHEKNIAYLDMKPENIMLTQVSNDVRLTDLGGCFADYSSLTAERTDGYAAPELAEDKMEEIDARTDIYGVGMLLQYIEENTDAKFPKYLTRIKERCLNPDKTLRYESTDHMLKALNRRKKKIRNTIITLALIIASVAGWQWYTTTTHYELMALQMNSDAVIEGVCYKILSEDSATCQVLGNVGFINIYIREKLKIDGKDYTVTEIADKAYYERISMPSVFLPKHIRRIGNEAFYKCEELSTITLPEDLEKLGHACFKGSGIKNIKFPKNLKTIGHASFAQCYGIEALHIPEGIETIEMDAFANCINMSSVTLPSTLKTISRGVFWDCQSLKEIHIPAQVSSIGEYVFYRCKNLKHVYNHSPEPQSLSVIFDRTDITLHVPAASVEKYRNAPHWNTLNIVGDL